MAAVGDVLVKFVADFAEFSTGMEASVKKLEQFGEQANKTSASIDGFFSLLKKGIAALGLQQAANQLLQFGEQIQKNAVEIANLATKYKLTSDQIQALQQIARRTGQPFEELAKIGQQNADWLAKVTENAKAAGDIIGGETVQKLKAMADASDDAHQKLEVLFAPLYANVKSTVLTTVANELTRINGILDAFNVSTLEKILLLSNPFALSAAGAGAVSNALFGSGPTAGQVVEQQIDKVNTQIAETVNQLAKLRAGGPNVWAGDIGLAEEKLKKLNDEHARLRELQKLPVLPAITVTPDLKPTGGGGGGGGGTTDEDSIAAQIRRYNSLKEAALDAYKTIKANQDKNIEDLTREVTVQRTTDEIVAKLIAKHIQVGAEQKKQLADAVRGYEIEKDLNQQRLKDAAAAVATEEKFGDGTKARVRVLHDLDNQYRSGRLSLDAYTRSLKQQSEALEQSSLEAKRYDDNLGSIAAGFEHAANAYSRSHDLYSSGEAAFTGLVDAMGEGLDALAGKSDKTFGQIAADFASMLAKMALQAALSQVFKAVFGAATGGGATADTIMGLIPVPGKASGGPVNAGSPYVVGENGPELFVPQAAGNIVPSSAASGSGGSGDSITVNVDMGTTQGTSDPSKALAFGRQMKAAIKDVIQNEKRPGGTLYSRASA